MGANVAPHQLDVIGLDGHRRPSESVIIHVHDQGQPRPRQPLVGGQGGGRRRRRGAEQGPTRLVGQLQGQHFLRVGEVRWQRQEHAFRPTQGVLQALERKAQGGGRVEAMPAGDPEALLTQGGEEIDAGEVRGLATQRGAGGADDGAALRQADGHRQVAAVVLQVEADGRPVAGAVDRAARVAFKSRPTRVMVRSGA